jgi:hypothetical protein
MQPAMLTRIATLFLALTLANCAQNPVTGNPNLVLLSESQEIAIGRREDTSVRKWDSVYPASEPMAGQPLKIVE